MASKKHSKAGRPAIYPWSKWLRHGRKLTLEKGRDFACEAQSLVLMARRYLRKRGMTAHISVRDLSVRIVVPKKDRPCQSFPSQDQGITSEQTQESLEA